MVVGVAGIDGAVLVVEVAGITGVDGAVLVVEVAGVAGAVLVAGGRSASGVGPLFQERAILLGR